VTKPSRAIVDIRATVTLSLIYAFLVAYGRLYQYYLADILQFHNNWLMYAGDRTWEYVFVEWTMPLAVLPIGHRLGRAGQYLVGLLVIFLFMPTPLLFVALVSGPEFLRVYVLYWVSVFLMSAAANFALPIHAKSIVPRQFVRTYMVIFVLVLTVLLGLAVRDGVRLIDYKDAGIVRSESGLIPGAGYAIYAFVGALGGLGLTIAMWQRRWLMLLLVIGTFLFSYLVFPIRTALLAPLWWLYFLVGQKYFFHNSVLRLLIYLAVPFIVLCGIASVTSFDRAGVVYSLVSFINYRLYTIPPAGFGVYWNFFRSHPHTWGSQIHIVSLFVHYPYAANLGAVMEDAYHVGNYNTNFLASDGLASGGVRVIPLTAVVFSGVLILVNTAYRKMSLLYTATTMAIPALMLIDSSISIALLTNGLGALILLSFFAPRGWIGGEFPKAKEIGLHSDSLNCGPASTNQTLS